MRISCHFERSAAESRNLVLSTLLKTGLTDLWPSVEMTMAQVLITIGIKAKNVKP